jgi:hypothetical protein
MKKTIFISIVSALVLGLASCNENDGLEITPGNLVGTWNALHYSGWQKENGETESFNEPEEDDYRYVFNEDGSGLEGYFEDGERTTDSDDFTWELSGNKLTLDGDEEYTVEQITSTRLVISAHYSETYEGDTYEEYTRATLARMK